MAETCAKSILSWSACQQKKKAADESRFQAGETTQSSAEIWYNLENKVVMSLQLYMCGRSVEAQTLKRVQRMGPRAAKYDNT